MKKDSIKFARNHDSRIKTYSRLGFRSCIRTSCFLFLAFCCLSSSTHAEAPPAQLDPTDLLTSYLIALSEEGSIPSVSRQVASPQQVWLTLSDHNVPARQEVAGIVAVEHSDKADHNLPEDSLNIPEDSNSRQEPNLGNDNLEERISIISQYPEGAMYGDKHQLWQARISAPASEDDKEDKDELQKLILRVYSIEFKRTGQSLETMTVIESVSTAGPNETSTDPEAEVPEELEEKATALKPAYGTVSDQTLQMLRELLRHPDRLDNPFELAEVLFLSGHVKEAALAYKEALNRRSPNQPDLTNDRAWILLQIGNCLRYDNMPAAAQSYKKLITEYPDSPWCDLAKAQYKLIEWHLEDEPQTLTAEDVSLNSLTKNGATGSD